MAARLPRGRGPVTSAAAAGMDHRPQWRIPVLPAGERQHHYDSQSVRAGQIIVQRLPHQLPHDNGQDAHWEPPGHVLYQAENLLGRAGGAANRRWAAIAADRNWQQYGGANGNSQVWHRPSHVFGTSGSSFSTMAHEPWTSTAGSSHDPLPQQQHGAPSAAANRNIEACHLRSRALQSQWNDEQDKQRRALLDKQASQTVAILDAGNAARGNVQRRLSRPGEETTHAAAGTASSPHLPRLAPRLSLDLLRAHRLRQTPGPS